VSGVDWLPGNQSRVKQIQLRVGYLCLSHSPQNPFAHPWVKHLDDGVLDTISLLVSSSRDHTPKTFECAFMHIHLFRGFLLKTKQFPNITGNHLFNSLQTEWETQHSFIKDMRLLTVNSWIKVSLDLQVDKSPVVVKGPFFPRVVNPRYRIRGTMCNTRIQSSKASKTILWRTKLHLI
jgi:hypothetical protein